MSTKKKAVVTNENREESRRLKEIWETTGHSGLTQAEFGEKFKIGTQPAVGFFLNGNSALSFKAARGFAEGLGCSISDFSPRLAQEAELNAQFATNQISGEPSAEIAELNKVVVRLTTSGQMQMAEVEAMTAMLKAREGAAKP